MGVPYSRAPHHPSIIQVGATKVHLLGISVLRFKVSRNRVSFLHVNFHVMQFPTRFRVWDDSLL